MSLLKDNAIIINTARGSIVNEKDLFEQFEKNRLYAAFDVFWKEPYDGILKNFLYKRFFMSPHVASTCREFLDGCAEDLNKFMRSTIIVSPTSAPSIINLALNC